MYRCGMHDEIFLMIIIHHSVLQLLLSFTIQVDVARHFSTVFVQAVNGGEVAPYSASLWCVY